MFDFLLKLFTTNHFNAYITHNLFRIDTHDSHIHCYAYGNLNILMKHIKNTNLRIIKYKFDDHHIFSYIHKNHIVILTPMSLHDNNYNYNQFHNFLLHLFIDYSLKDVIIRKFTYDLFQYYTSQQKIPIVNELNKIYNSVSMYKNRLIVNELIVPKTFIYDHYSKMEDIPENCKTTIFQLEFITNHSNELLEVVVESDNKLHPNINPKDNKYCIGNYRHNILTKELVERIISDIQVYNLTNCYEIPEPLKKYIFEK